jgi:exosome complex component MTR3
MITTALVRSIVLERYPKSSIEIMVTVLDCEDGPHSDVGVLSGAITAGSAALADAGVECVDLVCGGVAGLDGEGQVVLDPGPGECTAVVGVGYLAARDEMTVLWTRGGMSVELEEDQMDMGGESEMEKAIGAACKAAREVRKVLNEAVAERLVVELEEKENAMKD